MFDTPIPRKNPAFYFPRLDYAEAGRRAKQAELDAALAHRRISDTLTADDDPGLALMQALAAPAAMADARRNAMAAAETPLARKLLDPALAAREAALNNAIGAHLERALRTAHTIIARQQLDQAKMAAATATDPGTLLANLAAIHTAHDRIGALTDADPADVQAAKARDFSDVHGGQVLTHLNRGDLPGALAWHAATEPLLTDADNAQVKAALAGAAAQDRPSSDPGASVSQPADSQGAQSPTGTFDDEPTFASQHFGSDDASAIPAQAVAEGQLPDPAGHTPPSSDAPGTNEIVVTAPRRNEPPFALPKRGGYPGTGPNARTVSDLAWFSNEGMGRYKADALNAFGTAVFGGFSDPVRRVAEALRRGYEIVDEAAGPGHARDPFKLQGAAAMLELGMSDPQFGPEFRIMHNVVAEAKHRIDALGTDWDAEFANDFAKKFVEVNANFNPVMNALDVAIKLRNGEIDPTEAAIRLVPMSKVGGSLERLAEGGGKALLGREGERVAEDALPKISPLPESYIQPGVVVDMRMAPGGSDLNAAGFSRNGRWFWRQLAKSNPEYFDADNLARTGAGRSPIVNPTWIKKFPSHAGFLGGRLVHHHIDQGPMATPIPEAVHIAWHKTLHPNR